MIFLIASAILVTTAHAQTIEYIDIGVLVPKSGSIAGIGAHLEAASIYGVEQFNAHLAAQNADWRLRLNSTSILDTRSDTAAALMAAETLHQTNGIDYIIGPARSAGVDAVRQAINNDGWNVLLVSCCSTASDLAIADTIFRLSPADDKQGPHISRFLHNEGVDVLIPVWINDPYGNGLANSTASHYRTLGHTAIYTEQDDSTAQYTASSEIRAYKECTDKNGDAAGKANPTCDGQFTLLASDLNDVVTQQILMHGADRVAIMYIGFAADDFVRAANEYPALKLVRWVGADSTASASSLTSDENVDVRNFLYGANFRASVFAAPSGGQTYADVTEHLEGLFPGETILYYAYSSYDAPWAIGLAIQKAKADSVAVTVQNVAERLPGEIAGHTGAALGTIRLDASGDLTNGSYEIHGITKSPGADPAWNVIGTFNPRGMFVPQYKADIDIIDIGLLLNTKKEIGSYFDDDKYGFIMQMGIYDWNTQNDRHRITPHTIDISTGTLPAINAIQHGMYDSFYLPRLNSTINAAIAAYSSDTFNINGVFQNDQFYPFVINSTGHVRFSGAAQVTEAGEPDIDDITPSDRTSEQIFDIFAETDSPDYLWWEYQNGTKIKRTLLVHHEESGMVIGAGYDAIFGGDAGHREFLADSISDAINTIRGNGNDTTSLSNTWNLQTSKSPFYAFVAATNGSVLASAAHPAGLMINASDLKGLDKTLAQINSELLRDGTTWAQYYFNNPLNGIEERKRILIELHDIGGEQYGVGAGYYPSDALQYFAGPTTSANLSPIISYPGIVTVSPSSTANALAIRDDVFRLTPPDVASVAKIIDMLRQDGKKHVVILQRDDVWGEGIVSHIIQNRDIMFYRLEAAELLPTGNVAGFDFSALATSLNTKTQEAITTAGSADDVAILYVGFPDNLIRLMNAADTTTSIPNNAPLFTTPYYGTNGIAAEDSISSDATTAEILNNAGIKTPAYFISDNSINQKIKSDAAKSSIMLMNHYHASSYDSVRLLGDAVASSDDAPGASRILGSTSGYKGALNSDIGISLDSNGDLAATIDDYITYEIVASGGTYQWSTDSQLCSLGIASTSMDFGRADQYTLLSHQRQQTLTNTGSHTIDLLDVFPNDYSSLIVSSSLVELDSGHGFERLLSKKTLAESLHPGQSIIISYRMNFEHADTLADVEELMQNVSYRIICRP